MLKIKDKEKLFFLLGAIIILIIILVFVFTGQGNEEDIIKIGVPTLLSGSYADAGQNIVNSAELAAEKINQAGGVNGKRLLIIAEDSELSSATGISATRKLIDVDGVDFIVSGMTTNGILAAAPILNENQIVTLSAVTGGGNVDNAGDYIFRIANSDILAGRDIAEGMVALGYTKVGAIAETTEYTIDIKNSFIETIIAEGGEAAAEDEFQSDTVDFRTIILKMKEENVEAILVASQTGIGGANFVKQSRELGLDVPIFTDFTFVTNTAAQEIVRSFEGIYFADPAYDTEDPALVEFFADYKEKYGRDPLIPFHSAAAYDSVQILAEAINEAGEDPVNVQEWISENIKNYDGFMGNYSLDEEGNSDIGFVIKRIENGQYVIVQ